MLAFKNSLDNCFGDYIKGISEWLSDVTCVIKDRFSEIMSAMQTIKLGVDGGQTLRKLEDSI